jgi:hypothetical protein
LRKRWVNKRKGEKRERQGGKNIKIAAKFGKGPQKGPDVMTLPIQVFGVKKNTLPPLTLRPS